MKRRMMHQIPYGALHMAILFMALGELAFAGAAVEGSMHPAAALAVCGLLAGGIRLAWRGICRMERLARQAARAAARRAAAGTAGARPADASAAAAACPSGQRRAAPDLRVA